MINYSIIIPHKNIPDLLQRCLDSIPRRDDVQIIVVDDNSDPKIVDFERFPGANDPFVEVYFPKKGRGAGYARNVGLDYAKGKWVLFADADDWYMDDLSETMDKYVCSECDMLIFRTKRIGLNGDDVKNDLEEFFEEAIVKNNYDPIKYTYVCPVGKFIKRCIIEKNKIRFQEVKYSNDVMFALKLSSSCHFIEVVDKQIYCVYESRNSLTRNNNWRNPHTRIKVSLDAYLFLKSIGKGNILNDLWISYWNWLWKINKTIAIYDLFAIVLPKLGFREFWQKFKFIVQKNYPKYYAKIFKDANV